MGNVFEVWLGLTLLNGSFPVYFFSNFAFEAIDRFIGIAGTFAQFNCILIIPLIAVSVAHMTGHHMVKTFARCLGIFGVFAQIGEIFVVPF